MVERLKQPRFSQAQAQGIFAALLSALVLGLAPTFGKQAINAGTPALSVVALRTVFASLSLWLVFGLLPATRRFVYIYPVGLWGCLAAGVINGLGSLMYYTGLARLDASLAQMLYTLYPIFLTLLLRLEGHVISRFTIFRLAVALYTLSAMAVTVTIGYVVAGTPALPPNVGAWQAVLLLTAVTLISRLALFTGLKRLGGVQTALIGLCELLVTVLSAFVLLGEKLSPVQWLGAALLAASVLLVARESRLGTLPTPRAWTPQVFGRSFAKPGELPPQSAPSAEAPPEAERPPQPAATPPHLPS